MRKELTKEEIEEGKQEFTYINNCFMELVKENFDINNYQDVFDNTHETLKQLIYYEINVKCFYKIQDNIDNGDPEIRCFYRNDHDQLPKLKKILTYKRGFKFLIEFKGKEIKSKMVYFTHFAKFEKTFDSLISALKTKYTNKFYC